MKEKFYIRWIAVVLLASIACVALASDKRVEPNAFLSTKANSVTQLINEVETDPAVADRYVRHFGKSKQELAAYFGTLHLAKLNATGVYIIYSVDSEGVIKSHPQKMKVGTLVFADSGGQPILKASCGNAMVSGTNAQLPIMSPAIGQATETIQSVEATPPGSVEEGMAQNVVLTPTSPVALAPEMPLPTGTGNQGFVLPAVLAALSGAGSIWISDRHNPVPEPAAILVMATALIGLRCRRKSK